MKRFVVRGGINNGPVLGALGVDNMFAAMVFALFFSTTSAVMNRTGFLSIGVALSGMRVKLRRIVQSAESAKQQSPGRKPWERHAYEPSPPKELELSYWAYVDSYQ